MADEVDRYVQSLIDGTDYAKMKDQEAKIRRAERQGSTAEIPPPVLKVLPTENRGRVDSFHAKPSQSA